MYDGVFVCSEGTETMAFLDWDGLYFASRDLNRAARELLVDGGIGAGAKDKGQR